MPSFASPPRPGRSGGYSQPRQPPGWWLVYARGGPAPEWPWRCPLAPFYIEQLQGWMARRADARSWRSSLHGYRGPTLWTVIAVTGGRVLPDFLAEVGDIACEATALTALSRGLPPAQL